MNEMTPLDVELPLGETLESSLRRQLQWWRSVARTHEDANRQLNLSLKAAYKKLDENERLNTTALQSALDSMSKALNRKTKATMKRDVLMIIEQLARNYSLRFSYKEPAE